MDLEKYLASNEDKILFKTKYKFKNFLTPIIIDYYSNYKYIIELSKARNMYYGKLNIYGVTVFNKETEDDETLSTSFDNEKDAINYINDLLNVYEN